MLSSSAPHALLALAFVLVLAYGGQSLFRRVGPLRAGRPYRVTSDVRLSIRGSLALDPRRRVVILSCDGREGLVIVSAIDENFLGWLPSRESGGEGSSSR